MNKILKTVLIILLVKIILIGAYAYYYYYYTKEGVSKVAYYKHGQRQFQDEQNLMQGLTKEGFFVYAKTLTINQLRNFDVEKYKIYVLST